MRILLSIKKNEFLPTDFSVVSNAQGYLVNHFGKSAVSKVVESEEKEKKCGGPEE